MLLSSIILRRILSFIDQLDDVFTLTSEREKVETLLLHQMILKRSTNNLRTSNESSINHISFIPFFMCFVTGALLLMADVGKKGRNYNE